MCKNAGTKGIYDEKYNGFIREKRRDLTQPYEKSPTLTKTTEEKRQHSRQ